MANITLAGTLLDSIGEVDVGAIVTFTHLTTTGQTIKGTSNNLVVPPNGAYSINVEYGQIRIDYTTRFTERFVAIVLVNSDSTATNLPDLLLSADIPTNPQIAQFQAYLADTVVAKDAAVVAKNAAEDALAAIPTYGTAATADVTTSTTDTTAGRVLRAEDAYATNSINFHTGNTNFNVFGGIAAGDRVATGFAVSATVAIFFLDISSVTSATGITAFGTFDALNAGLSTIASSVTLALSSSSNNKKVVLVATVSGRTIGEPLILITGTASSRIQVNF